MTVPVQTTYNAYTANGATTVFPYGFKILAAADLQVLVNNVVTVTGFTVSGVGGGTGGNVTFSVAPVNGTVITLRLVPVLNRTVDFQQFGDWIAATVNNEFDRIWLALQSVWQNTSRAIKLREDTTTDQVITESAADRADKMIGFDALGALKLFVMQTGTSLVNLAASFGSSLIGFIQSGTGAGVRTVQDKLMESVHITDFYANGVSGVMVVLDGATDCTGGYLAALTAASTVLIPAGTLIINSVEVPSNRTVRGIGKFATIIKMKDSVNSNIHTIANKSNIEFYDLTINGNSANNLISGSGAYITSSSLRINFNNCRITNFRSAGIAAAGASRISAKFCRFDSNIFDGFQMTTVDIPSILFCEVESNGRYGAVFGSACTNIRDIGNEYINNIGGGSIMVGGSSAIRIGNLASGNTGHGLQYNNVIRGLYVGNICQNNTGSGLDFTLGAGYGIASGNISFQNGWRGLEIDSGSHFCTATSNILYQNYESGITNYACSNTIISSNQVVDNNLGNTTYSGIDVTSYAGNTCNDLIISANNSTGTGLYQKYGLAIVDPTAIITGMRVTANNLGGNVTSPVLAPTGTIFRARDNQSWITQNQGTSSILSGTTAITINHGLSVTPVADNFTIFPTALSTADPGEIYITAITSTQFTVNCRTNPGVSNLPFSWKVSAY
jgi:hypothetical protein